MHNYKELKIWIKSMDLVVEVYKITKDFPKEEKYGLTSQLWRCAVSIASNIAEGPGRNSNKEFCHFLSTAHGSSYELETQILASERLGLINKKQSDDICNRVCEIQKMNYSLQLRLNPELKTNK
jgi:four helix bundle protein